MTQPIIRLENISKRYIINHEAQASYTTLIDTLSSQARNAWNYAKSFANSANSIPKRIPEEFWALNNINFSINQGECVGIIGRNGAGKSTLLKIMSRIVTPTSGKMFVHGRLASLLEVGTGFHQELSGRENIFLNGSLLGMKKKDILRNFDEIVAFADIEKFLDTPVKRYSSGMYTRLGFSIAAHLNPDILIVDEVLAVGDFAFQQKCFQKIDRLGNEGKTIIFVSHDINSVLKLCSKAIYLENGQIEMIGQTEDCAKAYLGRNSDASSISKTKQELYPLGIRAIKFLNLESSNRFYVQGQTAQIEIDYHFDEISDDYYIQLEIIDARGNSIASSKTSTSEGIKLVSKPWKLTFDLDTSAFYPGEYTIKAMSCKKNHQASNKEICLPFIIYSKKENAEIAFGMKLASSWKK